MKKPLYSPKNSSKNPNGKFLNEKNKVKIKKWNFKWKISFLKWENFPKIPQKIPNGILNGKVSMSISVDSVF